MRKTIFSVITSNFIGAGIGFLINVVLARILTVEEYGRINLIFSFVIIFFSLFEFNFGNSLIIFLKKFEKGFKEDSKQLIFYVNGIFIRYLSKSFFFIGIILCLLYYFYDLSYLEVVVVLINFYTFLLYRYIVTIYQAVGNWKMFNILNILNNVVKSIVLVICYFSLGYYITKYNAILFGYGLFSIVVFSISYFNSRHFLKTSKLNFSERYFKVFKSIIIPLGISNIFILISMRIDNLVIEKILGPKALGIYAAANILALMFPLITSALRNVYLQKSSGKNSNYLKEIISQKKIWSVHPGFIVCSSFSSKTSIFIIVWAKI